MAEMKFYVDELPKSCCEEDCPFNYDTLGCRAIRFSIGDKAYERFWATDEYNVIQEYLNGKKGKITYPQCPLKLLDKEETK